MGAHLRRLRMLKRLRHVEALEARISALENHHGLHHEQLAAALREVNSFTEEHLAAVNRAKKLLQERTPKRVTDDEVLRLRRGR